MRKLFAVLALASLAVLPATAYAVNTYFNGLMGPGGSAQSGVYTTHTYSEIDGTYVAGRLYRTGYLIACCSGSSFYSGSAYTADLNFRYEPDAASSKAYCSRSADGSGSSTVTCSTNI
ncbi:MAG: hypothetical protein JWM98_2119 [Thermoleophilia bacterium]|nr:hypothetical protein [Thermoleophilia bacterium]